MEITGVSLQRPTGYVVLAPFVIKLSRNALISLKNCAGFVMGFFCRFDLKGLCTFCTRKNTISTDLHQNLHSLKIMIVESFPENITY